MKKKMLYLWSQTIMTNIHQLVEASIYLNNLDLSTELKDAQSLFKQLEVAHLKWFRLKKCVDLFQELKSIEHELIANIAHQLPHDKYDAINNISIFLNDQIKHNFNQILRLNQDFDESYENKLKQHHKEISIDAATKIHLRDLELQKSTLIQIEIEKAKLENAMQQTLLSNKLAIKEKELELIRVSKEMESCKLEQLKLRERLTESVNEFKS